MRAAALILAAGAATRMGTLKQLLPYRGKILLQHSIDRAVEAGFSPILVVVGASANEIRSSIAGPIEILENENWQTGMGSSIVTGIRSLLNRGGLSTALAILVPDQPLIEARHLVAMREALANTGAEIVAAEYAGTVGVPALFKRELFDELAGLRPEEGARSLLRHPSAKVTRFPLPEAAVDLDTREDFENFTSAAESRRT